MKYLLQKSESKPAGWVLTDTENMVVIEFEQNRFNDTQHITPLDDFDPRHFMELARIVREMADWLRDNHSDIIF